MLGAMALGGGGLIGCRNYTPMPQERRVPGARQEGAVGPGYGGEGTSMGASITINGLSQSQVHIGGNPSENRPQAGGMGSIAANEKLAGPSVSGPVPNIDNLFGQRKPQFVSQGQGVGGAGKQGTGGAGQQGAKQQKAPAQQQGAAQQHGAGRGGK